MSLLLRGVRVLLAALLVRLLCWDDRWFFLEQRFERRGELVAVALVKGLFLGPAGRVPTQAEAAG